MVGFISSSSYSMIKIDSLLTSTQCFFLFPQSCWTSLRIFPVTIQKQLCNVLRLDDMHAFLPDLEYRFPLLWCSIVIRCLCLHSEAFFVLMIYQLIRVLAIHSAISVVSILGCPRWLLLSLFIKYECAPKYGVSWFIMNELNRSFIFWIIPRIVLSLIVRIVPTPIKIVNHS